MKLPHNWHKMPTAKLRTILHKVRSKALTHLRHNELEQYECLKIVQSELEQFLNIKAH